MTGSVSVVLNVGGLHWATSQDVVERALARRPGVVDVAANAVTVARAGWILRWAVELGI